MPALSGVHSCFVQTARLKMHVLQKGQQGRTPLFFIHGNFSAATYYQELMLAMPDQFWCVAPDLRGYGDTEQKTIDARRGARDWSDDLRALLAELNVGSAHFLGWSAGAAPVMQLAIDAPDLVKSLCLVAPVSPYGFGGSYDQDGKPCWSDFAGSGGGMVSPAFIDRIRQQDRSSDMPESPRNVIRNSYFAKPWVHPREDELLDASLKQALGDRHYPGDVQDSDNWPFKGPGSLGVLNAISAKYHHLRDFADVANKPPVLWVRGDQDRIISDTSMSDPGYLGQLGVLPDWPGLDKYPPQPMVQQMRHLLERYQQAGGSYREEVMSGVGHSPFLEAPDVFIPLYLTFLQRLM